MRFQHGAVNRWAFARHPSTCSECGGDIVYGDRIVKYPDDDKTHHAYPGCLPFTGETWDEEDFNELDIEDLKKKLTILKKIDDDWATELIAYICKMNASSSYDEKPVEEEAMLELEERLLNSTNQELVFTTLKEIAEDAKRDIIRETAIELINNHCN